MLEQSDFDDAGIPGTIVVLPDGDRVLQLTEGATDEDFHAAMQILSPVDVDTPNNILSRIEHTNSWLLLKARLDALPPPPSSGEDPYLEARTRLQQEVDSALDLVESSGGAL